MRAAVVTDFTKPLEVQELPTPEPGPGQLLVRVEASGLCHTDIHAARGDWPVKPNPPFVPGHEGIGIVEGLGAGGLGHLALQYARIVGGLVTAVDIEPAKLELATELGADQVVNARTTDPVAAIQAVGGADVAVVLAASRKPFEQAFASLARGGRLVCVALPADGTMEIPIFDLVLGGKSVIGPIVGAP